MLIAILAAVALAAPGQYTDPTYGFSFAVPQLPQGATGETVTAVSVMSAARQGFASNINVQVQRLGTTRASYAQITRDQLKQYGMKVLSEKELTVSGRDAWQVDYQGRMDGYDLRFRALAVVGVDQVYLLTCTSLSSGFSQFETACQASIDSFRLD